MLVVCPTWVGDAVMATPALRLLRRALPGAFVGALCRSAAIDTLAGLDVFDEVHSAPSGGIMAPKVAAQRVRARRYDAALLLTNSFSTALSVRVAGIPRRIGYDRDGRGMLLTDAITPQRRRDTPPFNGSSTDPGGWAPIPTCLVYERLTRFFLDRLGADAAIPIGPLELAVTPGERAAADAVLTRAGLAASAPFVVLNPGGNNPAKRWPAERFAAVAGRLARDRGLSVLVNGSPAESEMCAAIVSNAVSASGSGATPGAWAGPVAVANPGATIADLTRLGGSLGALKSILARASLLVTNDTGPRHIAAALGTPVVALFGPTDPRWTTITPWLPPRRDGRGLPLEIEIVADPTLPEQEVSNDHAARCAIGRVSEADVLAACARLLG